MMNRAIGSVLLLFLPAVTLPQGIAPSNPRERSQFIVSLRDTILRLPQPYIVPGSERVRVDSFLLVRGREYLLDPPAGSLTLDGERLRSALNRTAESTAPVLLTVEYDRYPIAFKPSYALRTLTIRRDTAGENVIRVATPITRSFIADAFGPGLQKSGSLVRGFTIGSNRDMTLNSGLRLQMAGRLAEDVDIVAALTDENSPIQPEGTTQTLREVDKVFVEIRHPRFGATLGDFNLEVGKNEGGEFGSVVRKLQGARATARLGDVQGMNAVVALTGAAARGKYQTNQFTGIDGVQGPYRLTGKNGERRIVIVAGSERVYLNGTLMVRGETNDYVIDYASGEVTFASRRLLTNASRITVDFEYSDRAFTRNVLGASATGTFASGAGRAGISLIQEADDPDAPLDAELSEQGKEVLRQSGNDRMRAVLPGIRIAGRDSVTGRARGAYLLRDTLVAGRTISILVYAPGDSLALYDAIFSPVETVPIDSAGYVRVGVGVFRFAGLGAGTHLPVQFLPMPQRHQLIDVNGEIALTNDLRVRGEYAGSAFDPNRFASGGDQGGSAHTLAINYKPKQMHLGGLDLGDADMEVRERRRSAAFRSLDRDEGVEFARDWNVPIDRTTDEIMREAELRWKPRTWLTTGASYGLLDRAGAMRSTRWKADASVQDSSGSTVAYNVERIATDDAGTAAEAAWVKQLGSASWEAGGITPGIRIETENRRQTSHGNDSAWLGSFRFLEIAPKLETRPWRGISLAGEVQFRTEDSANVGQLHRASNAVTQIYSGQWTASTSFSTSLALNIRRVRFTEEFRTRGNSDAEVLLLRSQTRMNGWNRAAEADLYYEFSNQRSARMERVFVRVPQGSGSYRYLGDLNGNGAADEPEFEAVRFDGDYVVLYLPGEQLLPVADLKASVRLRMTPSRILSKTTGVLAKALSAVSTETYLRLDERSRDPDTKQIYLLNFERMLDAANTLAGSQQITQDILLFENDRDLSFRFRLSDRRGLVQLVTATERSALMERSMRVRSQLVPEIGNQTDVILRNDRVTASTLSSRVRDITSVMVQSDFSYRPDREWEAGMVVGGGDAENRSSTGLTRASMNEQSLRLIRAIPGTGQMRAEFKREEVVFQGSQVSVPFELTGGKSAGKTWIWQAWFDYRFTANLQLTLNYSGRTEGGRAPVHSARAEARAFF